MKPFDFKHWQTLAEQDPEQFEQARQQAIRAVIEQTESGRDRRRLNGLQFRIDMERQLCSNPMSSCIKLSKMMMAMLHEEFIPAVAQMSKNGANNYPAYFINKRYTNNILTFPTKSAITTRYSS